MISFKCEMNHSFFSAPKDSAICPVCTHAAYPAEKWIQDRTPKKKIYFCSCGKQKSKGAVRCMDCRAKTMRNKPLPKISLEKKIQRKISISKQNIARWERMIVSYSKNKIIQKNEEKKE